MAMPALASGADGAVHANEHAAAAAVTAVTKTAAALKKTSPSSSISTLLSPGETALLEYRKLIQKYKDKQVTEYYVPDLSEEDLDQFGWQVPIRLHEEPLPWTLPIEAFFHRPSPEEIHKFFFKGTNHEVCIRQIFSHVPLSEDEQQWLEQFRDLCNRKNWAIPFFLEPHVLRIVWFCKRKFPEDAMNKSLEHAQLMVDWRREFYPIDDSEPDLRTLLKLGVMYWVGRDPSLRPLLIVRLSRLPRSTAPELFKRLTIFCFEWALRYLMLPGVVETCLVLFDVRAVPLHQFPISALIDMVTTLTKQFPFRLHRMWIINDSFFVQTAWNIAKQFLTDVQQQKVQFYRTGFEVELAKAYAPHQLEKHYGGIRELTEFYPFPVAPGPFAVNTPEARHQIPAIFPYKAADRFTAFGVCWEGKCRVPLQWSPIAGEVFKSVHLPAPPAAVSLEDSATAAALAAIERATFAQRKSCIQSYKSLPRRYSLLTELGGENRGNRAARNGATLLYSPSSSSSSSYSSSSGNLPTTTATAAESIHPNTQYNYNIKNSSTSGGGEGSSSYGGAALVVEGAADMIEAAVLEQPLFPDRAAAPGLVGREISKRLSAAGFTVTTTTNMPLLLTTTEENSSQSQQQSKNASGDDRPPVADDETNETAALPAEAPTNRLRAAQVDAATAASVVKEGDDKGKETPTKKLQPSSFTPGDDGGAASATVADSILPTAANFGSNAAAASFSESQNLGPLPQHTKQDQKVEKTETAKRAVADVPKQTEKKSGSAVQAGVHSSPSEHKMMKAASQTVQKVKAGKCCKGWLF